MRIWIDMSNSPHPLLFAPLARELEQEGHEVLVTARDNAQTRELTTERWPDAEIIGAPTRRSRLRKAELILGRVVRLRSWARTRRPDLALSHNSYAQILAARSLGIRAVTAMDYEHQPVNHLAFRIANRVVLPDAFPEDVARRQGARQRKARRYAGFKEEIYLGDFRPRPDVVRELGIARENGKALVVTRTPPSGATYHQFGNPGFERLLERIAVAGECSCVVLPRSAEQRAALEGRRLPNVVVPQRAVDTRSLIHAADLFVGAGGTMSREAALLGVPAVSLYAGRRPAVDVALAERGLLHIAASEEDIGPVRPRSSEPRTQEELQGRAAEVRASFLRAALD